MGEIKLFHAQTSVVTGVIENALEAEVDLAGVNG